MILQIPDVLTPEEVKEFRETLEKATWVDGKKTAGHVANLAKKNQQLDHRSPEAKALGEKILMALEKSSAFFSAALPAKVFPPMFNSYLEGEEYSAHIDNAIRQVPGTSFRLRADLSATLFLSNPDEYEGGELTIEDTYGTHKIKLPAGHLILYPSSSLHHVNAITKGRRISSFFWIESMIREDSQRTILFDLDNSIRAFNDELPGHKATVNLMGVYHNLLRSWASI